MRTVRAIRLVHGLPGGSQPALVLTDDGFYVVKWKQNPQHRRVLINEAIGSEVLSRLSIATPKWAMVRADEAFLRGNPEARIALKNRSVPIQVGWHFGSKFAVNPLTTSVYDSVPSHLFDRIANLSDFIKVLVFDCWVDNNDRRQAIYFRTARKSLFVQMIDNGYAFGFDSENWRMRDRRIFAKPPLSDLYCSRDSDEHFESAIADARAISKNDLDGIQRTLPPEWVEGDAQIITRLFDELIKRARRLPEVIADAREHASNQNTTRLHPTPPRDIKQIYGRLLSEV